MPNRYANLTPSAKISQEYTKITEGFDKVQQEMDQRTAKDNDLQSQITAHKNDTKAHPAEHITYSGKVSGASNIKQAADKLNDRIDNIVAQGGSDNTEVVDARMGADGVARPTLGTLVREIHAQQIDSARQTVTLKHGQNIVTTDQASPAEIIVKGRTLVNLLGSDGNFEVDSDGNRIANGWSLIGNATPTIETAIVRYGTKSQKLVVIGGYPHLMKKIVFESGKYYVIIVDCYCSAANEALLAIYPSGGGSGSITSTLANQWQTLYYKFVGDGSTREIRLFASASGIPGVTTIFDGVSVYEVDVETYTAIGTTITRTNIREYFPHVDGIQHVTNPVITKLGKNLLPPYPNTINANTKINGPYELEMNTTSGQNINTFQVPVIGNTKYTLQCDVVKLSGSGNAYGYLSYRDGQGNAIGTSITVTPTRNAITVTTPANAVIADFNQLCDGAVSAIFRNWQLELGENATPFEPRNDDHIYAECVLRSLPNGVRDVLDVSRKEKLANVGQVVLNGSENLSSFSAGSNYSYMVINGWQSANNSVRFNGTNPTAALAVNDEYLFAITGDGTTPASIIINNNGALVVTLPTAHASAQAFKDYLAAHPITLVYQLANPITETVPVEGSVALHDGANIIEVGEGVIIREKTTPQYSSLEGGHYFFNVKSSYWGVDHRFQYPAENVLKVYRDDKEFTRWSKYPAPSNTYGGFGVVINASDFVPGEYSVTYIASKYMMTANIVDATMIYNTNQKTVVDALTRDMADAKTEISIHDRILAEYAARLLALEEGV